MAADWGADPVLWIGWAQLQHLLTKVIDPQLHKTYTAYGEKSRLFGGILPMATQPYKERGLVKAFKLLPADGAVNIGQVTPDTAVVRPMTQPVYTNIWLNKNHINDTECAFEIGQRIKDLVKSGRDGIAQAATWLEQQIIDQLMFKWDLWRLLGRDAKIATIVTDPGGSPTDDTTNSMYIFELELQQDCVKMGIGKGRLLQACAVPGAFGGPIITLRNYSVPFKVISDPTPSTAGTYNFKVTVVAPYTAANKVAVKAQIVAIIATDIIVPWAKATASTTTMPVGGPNYGFPGWPFWSETDGSGAFEDIEDRGGAVGSAYLTDEDTQRSVDRNATSLEWAHLNPVVEEGAAAAVAAATFTLIDNVIEKLWAKMDHPISAAIFANGLINKKLISALGTAGLSQNMGAGDIKTRVRARYGVGAWVYDSLFTGEPVVVGSTSDLPPNQVMVTVMDEEDPGPAFEMVSPNPADWLIPPGAPLREINASGEFLHKEIAVRKQSGTMFPRSRLDNRFGIVRDIKPA